MNNEIKEILDKLNYLVRNEMCWWENYTVFSPDDTKALLDYITNLQLEQTKKVFDTIATLINENETCTYRTLIYDLLGFESDCYADLISGLTITNMLVDYENLREENKIFQENNQNMQIELCKVWKENEDYKSKFKKVIKYINDKSKFHEGCDIYMPLDANDLLNILQNGSEK